MGMPGQSAIALEDKVQPGGCRCGVCGRWTAHGSDDDSAFAWWGRGL